MISIILQRHGLLRYAQTFYYGNDPKENSELLILNKIKEVLQPPNF